ncbi:hypothetical protein [Pseudomonas baetica]|uniref:hypothetical protein n=1 Tax=Pseudomonas baetica TaxID=674054 RepID=UPI002405E321|nr:hypothetical protein [Pseudomonas baetica]MDF9778891.1 hypothetical protein [Pseudomonas baetica]
MIKISLDLTEATKAEYDTYMGSRLRKSVVDGLARDLRGCEVLVESSGGPHSVQRVESLDEGPATNAGSGYAGNCRKEKFMTHVVTRPDGQPITVTFTAGIPGPFDGPCIFLLDDGSIHAGEVVRNSGTFPAGALSTTNTAGGIHEKFEIPLRRVIGWADARPRDRN